MAQSVMSGAGGHASQIMATVELACVREPAKKRPRSPNAKCPATGRRSLELTASTNLATGENAMPTREQKAVQAPSRKPFSMSSANRPSRCPNPALPRPSQSPKARRGEGRRTRAFGCWPDKWPLGVSAPDMLPWLRTGSCVPPRSTLWGGLLFLFFNFNFVSVLSVCFL